MFTCECQLQVACFSLKFCMPITCVWHMSTSTLMTRLTCYSGTDSLPEYINQSNEIDHTKLVQSLYAMPIIWQLTCAAPTNSRDSYGYHGASRMWTPWMFETVPSSHDSPRVVRKLHHVAYTSFGQHGKVARNKNILVIRIPDCIV